MVKNNKNKSQSFSTDIIIVVVIILFGSLFLVMTKVNNSEGQLDVNKLYQEATEDSKIIFDEMKTTRIIDEQNNVKMESLKQLDIDFIKNDLGIRGDFCIVFEKDGKLVKIDSENNINGIGSSNILVNGLPCESN